MKLDFIIYQKTEHVARIVLNRPDTANALDLNLAHDLLLALEDVESDKEIRVVIITGAGKAFCSGGDVKYLLNIVSKQSNIEIRDFLTELGKPIMKIRELKQPVVAEINGSAVGAGFDLLLHCDIRIASEKAVMGPTWIRNAVIPVLGGMYILPKLVGQTKATEMILMGQTVQGDEAQKIGLVNKVVEPVKLEEETHLIAKDLARKSPLAMFIAKRGLQRGMDLYLRHELEHALYIQSVLFKTLDFKEGLSAFLEKREPQFVGY